MSRPRTGALARHLRAAGWALAAILAAATPAAAQSHASTQAPLDNSAIHLGVASCAGNNCHGAVHPAKNSDVRQNEYFIWSQTTDPARIDKHHQAYAVLLNARSKRIARNLGIANPATAPLCLNCHADNVPPARRGPQFQLSDGVGCEACHGGSSKWLGVHLSGRGHAANLAAGLYPLERSIARARRCMSCHFGEPGNDQRFVTHRIMGAGHPRMPFELDTFTLAEPAHFVVDRDYIKRMGSVSDVRVWAVGQAFSLITRMDALINPKYAPKGVNPELVLFDCQTCHHGDRKQDLRWQPRPSTGLGPGMLQLYDANAVMLQVIAERVAPDVAKQLRTGMLALHRATTGNWSQVQQQARVVRGLAIKLEAKLVHTTFTTNDMKALAKGVIEVALSGNDRQFSGAEQETMALGSIASNMRMSGLIGAAQTAPVNADLARLNDLIADGQTYRPAPFVKALTQFQTTLPK